MESNDIPSSVPTNEKALDQEQLADTSDVPESGIKEASVLHEEDDPKVLAADALPFPDEIISKKSLFLI